MTYQLEVMRNHYILRNGQKAYIIDTGSPISISSSGSISLLGTDYPATDSLFDRISSMVQQQLGLRIDGLIGNDILKGHRVALDFPNDTITFDGPPVVTNDCVDLSFASSKIPLFGLLSLGIPTLDIVLNQQKIKAIFDTGAPIPYAKVPVLNNLTSVGVIRDFSPTHGNIVTQSYLAEFKIGSMVVKSIVAKATPEIEMEMSLVGAEAIIGPSLFSGCSSLVIDFQEMKLLFI